VFLVGMALVMSAGGLLWGVLCWRLHAGWRAGIPLGYVFLTIANLANLRRTRDFASTRTIQIAMTLVLPFALQWALGGFAASGTMILWSLIALLGSLTVQSTASAFGWLVSFLSLLILSTVIDPMLHEHVIVGSERDEVLAVSLNVGIIATIIFAMTSYFARSRAELNASLLQANQANERLIGQMLPARVAERLRAGEETIADHLPETTVVFCDVVGFTSWAQDVHPSIVVDTLRELFKRLDYLTRKHGLEKIKTIGDAYMAAAGIPTPQVDHVERALRLALDMLDVVKDMHSPDGKQLQLRIGMTCGPVIAGVIGQDKVLYDIWGSTVNFASRLETSGIPGTIHVSAEVRARLGSLVTCEPCGVKDLRGIGLVPTFVIRGTSARWDTGISTTPA
jgi:class 3 adenylate cyclase